MNDNYHILIVDQNSIKRQRLAELLQAEGCRVAIASDQLGGPDSLRAVDYHLVLLDLTTICSRNSRECYQQIGRLAGIGDKPMIIMSDDASLEYELLSTTDYLVSPVDPDRLISLVRHLRERQFTQEKTVRSEADFQALQEYLTKLTGIYFSSRNRHHLQENLQVRMRALWIDSYAAYIDYLIEFGESRNELKKLISLLTVGETLFFRYPNQISLFRGYLLPELIAKNRSSKTLRIWSAGCSTGEEPYTLAILLREYFPEVHDWAIRILATDINRRSLRTAAEGIYSERSLRQVEPQIREKYFSKIGLVYAVNPELKGLISFRELNLMEDCYPSGDNGTRKIDLLLCRNVMIYFQLPTIQAIIERFTRAIQPGGFFMLGHAERLHDPTGRFVSLTREKATCYQLNESSSSC